MPANITNLKQFIAEIDGDQGLPLQQVTVFAGSQ